jgi:hypothetical protein
VHFEEWMELVVHVFEAAGVAILAVGSLVALVGAVRAVSRGSGARHTNGHANTSAGRSCSDWKS